MVLVNVLQSLVGKIIHGLSLINFSWQLILVEHVLVGVALDRHATLDDYVGSTAANQNLCWDTRVELATVLLYFFSARGLAEELLLLLLLFIKLSGAVELSHESV